LINLFFWKISCYAGRENLRSSQSRTGENMSAEWFAGRLKELREQARLTQEQLAERAGMNKFGVAQLEQGRNKPSWETVLALAKALNVSCEAFTQEPAPRPAAGPGRPPKAEEGPRTAFPETGRSRGRKAGGEGNAGGKQRRKGTSG
jgi:transcriptional regulator with XRE-family HTH domain